MQRAVQLEITQNAKLTLCKIKFPPQNKGKARFTFFQILPIKQILINILYLTVSNCQFKFALNVTYCIFIMEHTKIYVTEE